MPSSNRVGLACTWLGTVTDDEGTEGALAFNLLTQNYVQFINPRKSVTLDNALVIACISAVQEEALTGKRPQGRPLMHGERLHAYQVMLSLGQVSDLRDIGEGNLSLGIRMVLASFKKSVS